ncbi:MAG: YfcC family protein [Acidaminococcus sp.]|jgi:uncharacterized ion transporter superfamily protein YfcC|nr:YfcC family protein [Acidaminococcus sp.]MCI2101091.1 YfcC family protein [Acidaminococcus sp.]MCI2115496.1 YfcC family protein [Acidaminococcus sp.]
MMPEQKKKKSKMLSSYSIVFLVLILVAILTWFVPQSVVVTKNGTKEIIYNAIMVKGKVVAGQGLQPMGLWDILAAPAKGFVKAAPVGFAILMAGSFLHIMNSTGAMSAGIGWLLRHFTGKTLLMVLVFVSSVFGSVYGLWEEIPAFSMMVVPLFIRAGYDVITGIGVLTVGATAGNMASVVNPFSVGAAVGAIGTEGLSMGSGIMLRMVVFVALTVVAIIYVLRYAAMVKDDPSRSVVYGLDVNTFVDEEKAEKHEEITRQQAMSIGLLVLMVLALVCGYIPWDSIKFADGSTMKDIINLPFTTLAQVPFLGNFFGAGHYTHFGDWYFDEYAFVFFTGALLLGVINKMPEEEFVHEFVEGAREMLGVILVLTIANAISVIMGSKTAGMSVTFVYWIQNALSGVPSWAFAIAAAASYLGIGFFMQSTSGVAGITMPILGAVAYALFQSAPIGSIGGQIMLISAFTIGLNFTSAIYPSATNMGTLELYKVPYNHYLGFILKADIAMLIVGVIIVSIAPSLGIL